MDSFAVCTIIKQYIKTATGCNEHLLQDFMGMASPEDPPAHRKGNKPSLFQRVHEHWMLKE